MKPLRVAIRGGGVSGWAAASLLAGKKELEIFLETRRSRNPAPTVLLNHLTFRLLKDLFGDLRTLRERSWVIRHKAVRWGDAPWTLLDAPALATPHRVLVQALEGYCRSYLGRRLVVRERVAENEFDLQVLACAMPDRQRSEWGKRVILSVDVGLARKSRLREARMTTCERGWLFVFPTGASSGVLQLMAPSRPATPRASLERAVRDLRSEGFELEADLDSLALFDAGPASDDAPCGGGSLAVGSGAARFDPICGDGTGFSLRSSLLCAAVAERLACGGADGDGLLDHYSRRIRSAFLNHLRACDRLYSEAAAGDLWRQDVELMRTGIGRLSRELGQEGYRYRLLGRSLSPVAAARASTDSAPHDGVL